MTPVTVSVTLVGMSQFNVFVNCVAKGCVLRGTRFELSLFLEASSQRDVYSCLVAETKDRILECVVEHPYFI